MKPIVVINDEGEVTRHHNFIVIKSRQVGATTMGAALKAFYEHKLPERKAPESKPKSAYDLRANGGLPQLKQRIEQMNRHAKKPGRLY